MCDVVSRNYFPSMKEVFLRLFHRFRWKSNEKTSQNFSSFANFLKKQFLLISFLLQFALREFKHQEDISRGEENIYQDESKPSALKIFSRVQLKYHSINFYLSLVSLFLSCCRQTFLPHFRLNFIVFISLEVHG